MNPFGGVNLSGIDLNHLANEGRKELIEERAKELTPEDQCTELMQTVKVRLAPSTIHGVGVVALKDIKVGEKCFIALTSKPRWYRLPFATLKARLSKHKEVLGLILDRWPRAVNNEPFLNPNYDARLTSFLNHSDTPNYSPVSDTALSHIKAGEEITEDYRSFPGWEKAFPWLVDKK